MSAWLARWQARLWWIFVALGAGIAAVAYPSMRGLELDPAWTALLPRDKPSVRDLERVGRRVSGLSTLTVVVQSDDSNALRRFAGDLVPRLQALGHENVRSIDWNVSAYEDFIAEHRHLYAEVDDLRVIRDALAARLEYERARANPLWIDLGEEPPDDPVAVAERIRAQLEERARERSAKRRAADARGYYLHPDGDLLAIFLRTDIRGGDVASAEVLIAAVEREARALRPSRYAADLRLEYAGDLVTTREEHDAIARELVVATVLTLALCALSLYLLFWRVRALLVLNLALAPPVMLSFAIAELTVGSLNSSTAFLGGIIIGNGINPGIVWLARYFEERRHGHDVETAIARTHRGAWSGTLAASVAASLAYGSLVVADFKGFRDFGIISGVGMVLCWLGMMLLLPALAAMSERIRPLRFRSAAAARGTLYGRAVIALVMRAPGRILAVMLALTVGSVAAIAWAVAHDPLEYDFSKLRSVREDASRAEALNKRVAVMVGRAGTGNAILVLAPRREDVPHLRAQLERLGARGQVGRVRSIDDLLPADQDAKLPLLREIRALMLDARRFAGEAQRSRIDAHLPPADLRPLGAADLPEVVARPFTERDGTRGRILVVEPARGRSTWDGRYLIEWARAIRGVRTERGEQPPLAGRAPVFADMIEVVVEDGPQAVGVSLLATVLLVLLAFRRTRHRIVTVVSLLVGVSWMAGVLALTGMKLNFLNFVAFPITFGNGVDYAVNVMRRYVQERDGPGSSERAVRAAVSETGGAIVVCSLTTVFGYISLLASANLALESFGTAMSVSEITCLCAAVIGIPAYLLWRERRMARGVQETVRRARDEDPAGRPR